MEHGKDTIEILTDVYDPLDSDSDTEAAEYATDHDQTAVHSGSSLTEHTTVVEPPITKENLKVEITVEEGILEPYIPVLTPSGVLDRHPHKTSHQGLEELPHRDS